MKVLVAYASRHGATAGIAQCIASTIAASGIPCEARPVEEVRDPAEYDAVVLGAAAYMFHWLKEANQFAHKHADVLANRPLWLFSSGPIGTELVDKDGRDVLAQSRPREFDELAARLHPRGERVFFGAFDPDAPAKGLAERAMKHMPAAARHAMPAGDFRDWTAIEGWAATIASELRASA